MHEGRREGLGEDARMSNRGSRAVMRAKVRNQDRSLAVAAVALPKLVLPEHIDEKGTYPEGVRQRSSEISRSVVLGEAVVCKKTSLSV